MLSVRFEKAICRALRPQPSPTATASDLPGGREFRFLKHTLKIKAFALFAVGLTIIGCNRDPVTTNELVEVHGTVLLDGLPVPDAKVVFVPEGVSSSSRFALAYGTTDSQGKFELKQRDGTVGALAARHRVYLSKLNRHLAMKKVGFPEKPRLDDQQLKNAEEIPEFYNRYSELQYEVVAGRGIVRPEFKLSSVDPLLKEE